MLNELILIGRLTEAPVLRQTSNAIPVVNFSIAVAHDFKDKAGNRGVDFFDVVAWDKKATFPSGYFGKGDTVCVKGRLTTREWTDKTEAKRKSYEVVVESSYLIEKAKGNPPASPAPDYTPLAPTNFEPPF